MSFNKEQFKSLRNVISSNVETIKKLITQSGQLSIIIDNLKETNEQNEQNKETKESLIALNSQISESITQFLEQTKKLFEGYDKLLDEAFKNML